MKKNSYILIIIFLLIGESSYSQDLNDNEIIYAGKHFYSSIDIGKLIKVGNPNEIYKKNVITGEIKTIYQGTVHQNYVRISPNGIYIASIQTGIRLEYKPYRSINNLIVLDISGNLVHEIDDDVRRYAWSPDGTRIAYITGKYREAKHYTITGYYILDIKTGISKPIEAKGGNLEWAEFDNQIYFKGWKYITKRRGIPMVYKYDPINNTFEETEYKGIYFSPDGKYYYRAPSEGGDFKLFIRESNIDITDRLRSAPLIHPYGEWLVDDILLLRDSATWGENYRKSFVFNLNKMDVVESFDGKPLATYKKDGKLKIVLYEDPEIITIEK